MREAQHTTTILRYMFKRILPFVAPVLLSAFFITYELTYRTIKEQQHDAIETELSFAQQTLDSRIQILEEWLRNLAQNGMVINSLVDPRGAGEYIPQLIKNLRVPGPKGDGHIIFLDFQGKVLATNNIKTSLEMDESWLNKVLEGQSYEAISYKGLIMAEPVIINGLPEGAMVLLLDASMLVSFMEVSSASGYMSVIDTNSHVIFSSPGQDYFQIGRKYNKKLFKDWVFSQKPIYGSSDLFVVFKQESKVVFQAVLDVQYALIAFIVISLGGILLSVSLSGRMSARVLGTVAKQIETLRADKNLSKRIEVSAIKELAYLEHSYNDMAENLQNTTVSKEYIDMLFDGMPLPVFVVDADGRIVRTNDPVLSMFENPESALPEYFQDAILHADLEKHQVELVSHFAYMPKNACDTFFYLSKKYGTHEMEMRIINNDTDTKPYILSTTSLKNKKGEVTGFIITATDIVDRKRQEKEILELAEQNILMARAIEKIDLGVTISDGRQRHHPLIFCNQSFIELSGRSMEEVLGFSCDFMQGPETDPNVVKAISEAIRDHKSIRVEILNYRKNGETFWNELSINPIFAHDGSLKYYVGIQHDITDRKHVEAMKKEFISTVSHELRTPLTSIHGSLGLINEFYEGDPDSEEKELLSVAYRNSERLKFLVDDILDTEKLEAGEMRFYPDYYKLTDIVQQGAQLNTAYGEKYGVDFVVADDLPDTYIHVDKQRIIQVFANILSNAAKFSKSSKQVDISAQILDLGEDIVRIAIRDYGDGISESFRKRLFIKFAQEDSSDVRALSGTGLGLYISKKIIEDHAGEIDFETKTGEGTTFYIDLPCYDTPAEEGEDNDEAA